MNQNLGRRNTHYDGRPKAATARAAPQQHALEYSAIEDDLLTKQNAKLLVVYDQQLEALEQVIRNLIRGGCHFKSTS